MVKLAEDFSYQLWPYDNKSIWINRFGLQTWLRNWRPTHQREDMLQLENMMDLRDGPSQSAIVSKPLTIKNVGLKRFAG